MPRIGVLSIFVIATIAPACAQERSGPAYESAMKGAMAMLSFDALAARCTAKGGFAAGDAATVKAWNRDQRTDAMRTRANALRSDPTNRSYLDQAVSAILSMADQRGANPCAAAVKSTVSVSIRGWPWDMADF